MEYWSKNDFENETAEHIELEYEGKKLIFKRLTAGEEKAIRKKVMTQVKDVKTGRYESEFDSNEYQTLILSEALIKPKLTKKEVETILWGKRADDLFILYTQKIGFGGLPVNL